MSAWHWLRLPCGDILCMAHVASIVVSTERDADGEFPSVRVVIPGCKDARYTQGDAEAILAWVPDWQKPEASSAMSSVDGQPASSVASGLAVALLRERIEAGGAVEIPSLNITITKDSDA